MVGIYKITNLVNGKSYIGQSINIQRRISRHKTTAFNQNSKHYENPIYRAIRKYGLENFKFEVLEECLGSELDEKEIYYIALYNTYGAGYNQTEGGSQGSHYTKLSKELVSEIILRLKTSTDNSEIIGKDFGVSGRTIRSINTGECCHRDDETYPIRQPLPSHPISFKDKSLNNKCKVCGIEIDDKFTYCLDCSHKVQRRVSDRPEPLDLAKMITEMGFESVGRKFGVSGNTIAKWCKSYGIPYKKKELEDWYNNQMGIIKSKTEKVKIVQEKPVKQIDMQTKEVLNIFPSENEAARSLGKKKGSHISEVCNGQLLSAYGYYWEYA